MRETAGHSNPDEQAIEWLVASNEPGIRLQARRDLLGEPVTLEADEITAARYGDAAGWKRESGSWMLTSNALRVLKAAGV